MITFKMISAIAVCLVFAIPFANAKFDIELISDEDTDIKFILKKFWSEMRGLLEDIKTEQGHIKRQCLENQQCIRRDQIDAFQNMFKSGRQEIVSALQQCPTKDLLSNFQALLTKDECDDGSHNCSDKATCTNTLGLYKCTCNSGYVGDGFTCQDLDECAENSNICGVGHLCRNQPGGYKCICNQGYKEEGNTCKDINECESGMPNKCHAKATCNNTIGNYSCHCRPPFEGDGYSCIVPTCPPPSQVISGLGCVIPVAEHMTWEAAMENCQKSGAILLEGIRREHLDLLAELFNPMFNWSPWIGFRGKVWVTSNDRVAFEDLIWHPSDPKGTSQEKDDCGRLYLNLSPANLFDYTCLSTLGSLCLKPI